MQWLKRIGIVIVLALAGYGAYQLVPKAEQVVG